MVRLKPNTERTTEHPYRGVFVFVRRTPTNNVRKCSLFAENVRLNSLERTAQRKDQCREKMTMVREGIGTSEKRNESRGFHSTKPASLRHEILNLRLYTDKPLQRLQFHES